MSARVDPGKADPFVDERRRMVDEQLVDRGIEAEDVIRALRTVPRHLFVPPDRRGRAYDDAALSLGPRQSISQPYIVATMTELAALRPGDRVLEVGTGSGYQAAVLAEITPEVFTIELDRELATRARDTLESLHYHTVRTRSGDGRLGWPEEAPFDVVLITACVPEPPPALLDQLAVGGRLVWPSGTAGATQTLRLLTRHLDGSSSHEDVLPVKFVPLEQPRP